MHCSFLDGNPSTRLAAVCQRVAATRNAGSTAAAGLRLSAHPHHRKPAWRSNACTVVTHNRLVKIVVHLALHVRMRVCMCIFDGDWFALFDALGLTQTCVKSEQTINVYVYKHDMLACIANVVHGVRHRWTFQNVRCDQRCGKHNAADD